ncbi:MULTISPECIES: hypothetical protein [Anaeromyxobacter]|uniref:hypothetical protein n=1 Tax=Anaeromyxobacter TaxID=161492 RepID=UPI001F56003B|nr:MULTISPECIES: hypothetical protein [unclassified Anaeromyxobacter]
MKNTKWLSLVAVAALAVACDPYSDAKKGSPQIVAVTAANLAGGADAVSADRTGEAWSSAGTCGGILDKDKAVVNPGQFDATTIFVTFDRQVDGGLVQTSLTDCTPAAGWLTVTPAAPAGSAWYSCYSPSSPSAAEGGSVVVYLGPAAGSDGWGDAEFIDGSAPVHITGTVAGRAIDVTLGACAP